MLRTNEDYQALISNIDFIYQKDADSHSYDVAVLAKQFGAFLHLNSKDLHRLYIGGLLHDLGKAFFDESLSTGAKDLTEKQKDMIYYHPLRGFMLAFKSIHDERILEMIAFHHERIDGKGYPYGLKGQDIPYLVKIISICDAFDAMTSKRGYKTQLTIEEAKVELDINKGNQFDFQLVEAFLLFFTQKEESIV